MLRRRGIGGPAVQMLLDIVVDLGGALRRQSLDEEVDRFIAAPVSVVDGLSLRHSPSISGDPAVAEMPPSKWHDRGMTGPFTGPQGA